MDETEKRLSYISARLREKSTYAGLLSFISFGVMLGSNYSSHLKGIDPNALVNALTALGMAIGSLMAVFLPEQSANGS